MAALYFICFIAASAASTILYFRSVSPAQLERQNDEAAYERCSRYCMASVVLMGLAVIYFVLCRSLPLSNWIATPFGWSRRLSFILALLLGLPALALAITGIQDMGSEWLTPVKKNKLVTRGNYNQISHLPASILGAFMARVRILAAFAALAGAFRSDCSARNNHGTGRGN